MLAPLLSSSPAAATATERPSRLLVGRLVAVQPRGCSIGVRRVCVSVYVNVSSSNVFESTAVEIAPTQEALYSSYYYATTAAFASVAYALDQGEHRCRSRERWPCCPSSNLRTKLTPCTTDIQGAPASFAIFQRIHASFKCGLFLEYPITWESGGEHPVQGNATTTTLFMLVSSSSQFADST